MPTPGPARCWCASKPRESIGLTSSSDSATTHRRPACPTCRASRLLGPSPPSDSDVSRWREGDSVCALVAGGGYARYRVAPEPQALPLPQGTRPGEAAAIPETFFTVWTNLFERGQPEGGRDGADPRRLERHRHDGSPARAGVRRDGLRNGRLRHQVRGVRATRGAGHQLPHGRLRPGHPRVDRLARSRRHSRHRRRRLPAAQHRVPRDARAA